MFRSTATLRNNAKGAKPHLNLTIETREGTVWSFWSLAPGQHCVWLTNGSEFILWNTKYRCQENGIINQCLEGLEFNRQCAPGRVLTDDASVKR